jgi:anti-sigma B factor antagonist
MISPQFREEDRDGRMTVIATGDIDLGNVERFSDVLRRAAGDGQPVVVDMVDVTYCDSAGMRALFKAGAGTDLTLRIDRAGPLKKLLDISGLDRVTTVELTDR